MRRRHLKKTLHTLSIFALMFNMSVNGTQKDRPTRPLEELGHLSTAGELQPFAGTPFLGGTLDITNSTVSSKAITITVGVGDESAGSCIPNDTRDFTKTISAGNEFTVTPYVEALTDIANINGVSDKSAWDCITYWIDDGDATGGNYNGFANRAYYKFSQNDNADVTLIEFDNIAGASPHLGNEWIPQSFIFTPPI